MKKSNGSILAIVFISLIMIGLTSPIINEISGKMEGTFHRILFCFGYLYSVALISFSIVCLTVFLIVCRIGNCFDIRKVLFRGFVLLCQSYGLIVTLAVQNPTWIDMTVGATVFSFIDINKMIFTISGKEYYYNGFLNIDDVVSKELGNKFTYYTILSGRKVYIKNK